MECKDHQSRRQVGEFENEAWEEGSVCSRCQWSAVERRRWNKKWQLYGVFIVEVKGLKEVHNTFYIPWPYKCVTKTIGYRTSHKYTKYWSRNNNMSKPTDSHFYRRQKKTWQILNLSICKYVTFSQIYKENKFFVSVKFGLEVCW